MISLAMDADFGATRFSRLARSQERLAPVVLPVTLIRVIRKKQEPRALRLARHVLRGMILTGALTAAWQIGAVIGHM